MDALRLFFKETFIMEFYKLKKVLQISGLSRSSIYQMMAKGLFPRNITIGSRAVAWTDESIEEWIQSRINASK
jgi:prophage regulatory protein